MSKKQKTEENTLMKKHFLHCYLHHSRWGRVAFVWPEKPFRAVSDVYPVTYFPTRSRLRVYGVGRERG